MAVVNRDHPWVMVATGSGSAAATAASATSIVTRVEGAHGQALFGFVRRLGIDDATAADVVQEGLVRLFDTVGRGKRIDDHRAWIFTVVYRLAMDEHRRRDRWSRVVSSLGRNGPTLSYDREDLLDRAMV
jgi:DNA-directed RNA polymerase specialized sigma24 family protein